MPIRSRSLIITESDKPRVQKKENKMTKAIAGSDAKLPPIHPGEILKEEFLVPLGVTQYRLAQGIGVDARRINAIIHGQRAITAETALLFSRFFGNSAEFWMGLQNQYDLEKEQDRLADRLSRVPEHGVRVPA